MSDILIADIGGTTSRAAFASLGGRPERIVTIANDSVDGPEGVLARMLDGATATSARGGARALPRRSMARRSRSPIATGVCGCRPFPRASGCRRSMRSTISRRWPGRCRRSAGSDLQPLGEATRLSAWREARGRSGHGPRRRGAGADRQRLPCDRERSRPFVVRSGLCRRGAVFRRLAEGEGAALGGMRALGRGPFGCCMRRCIPAR